MQSRLQRCSINIAGAARRLLPAPKAPQQLLSAPHVPLWNAGSLLRPFSVLSTAPWARFENVVQQQQRVQPLMPVATVKSDPSHSLAATAMPSAAPRVMQETAPAMPEAAQSMESMASAAEHCLDNAAKKNMVFEIGFTFIFMHYQSIFIFFARGLFQAFRPLLILFVFGQILKAVFFVAGAPIWCSFYSIWMFEVIYGLAQCAISFIFICSFYNNLSFARLRPALGQIIKRERERLLRATRAVLA
mmetsp:Transcript_118983/g.237186  ORF Transcript_118983/g.237186 Transcript_118983/m.237186 type:complete len:246 (+) Transcript_118983:73-810(+)